MLIILIRMYHNNKRANLTFWQILAEVCQPGRTICPITAAAFEMNSVMNVPAKHIAVITTIGFVPQMSRIPVAIRSAIPVFCIAKPSTALHAYKD